MQPSAQPTIAQLAEAWHNGTLPVAVRAALDARLAAEPAFAAEFGEALALLQSLEGAGRSEGFRAMLADIERDLKREAARPAEVPLAHKPVPRTIPLRTHYWRTAAVAAGIAMVASVSSFWISEQRAQKSRVAPYAMLRREIEAVKRSQSILASSQNQLINDLAAGRRPVPPAPVAASGTGFALTADGYFVTNYHVGRDADSIYIQTRSGDYYKAALVAFDPGADLAVLKVEDEGFRFSDGDLPYGFAPRKAGLGARVYTLGFPQDEVVYSEGYIAARNGYSGDSQQYRLALPAEPGQSGAPVLDAAGNVVGIVSGKGGAAGDATYAVSTGALLRLLESVPRKLALPKASKLARSPREAQIERMQDYTFLVRVYKK